MSTRDEVEIAMLADAIHQDITIGDPSREFQIKLIERACREPVYIKSNELEHYSKSRGKGKTAKPWER